METWIWGIKPDESVPYYWNARAIYSARDTYYENRTETLGGKKVKRKIAYAYLDIPFDRQEMVGGTPDERKALANWINKRGMLLLKEEIAKLYVDPRSDDDILIQADGYFILANPRRSGGYIYIVAGPVTKAVDRMTGKV